MKKTNKKGFTIVELVIVIAVIGILAGILIPTFSSITENAKRSAALSQARSTMDNTLTLTGGGYTSGTLFVVDYDEDGTPDYYFEYANNKLQAKDEAVKGSALPKYESGESGYYAAYVSSKISDTEQQAGILAYLAKVCGEDGDTDITFTHDTASKEGTNSYYTCTFTSSKDETVKKTFHIYYSVDIEKNLVVVLGANN